MIRCKTIYNSSKHNAADCGNPVTYRDVVGSFELLQSLPLISSNKIDKSFDFLIIEEVFFSREIVKVVELRFLMIRGEVIGGDCDRRDSGRRRSSPTAAVFLAGKILQVKLPYSIDFCT